jgi:hypothetical protein
MRASLLSRQKLQEALVDFDIGPGHRVEAPPEIAVEPVEDQTRMGVVGRLDDYRRPPSRRAKPFRADADNRSVGALALVRIRAGPLGRHVANRVVYGARSQGNIYERTAGLLPRQRVTVVGAR